MLHIMAGLIVSVVSLIMSLLSCDMGGIGGGGVSWEDPAGDVQNSKFQLSSGAIAEVPELDLVGVRAEAKDGHINITAKIDGSFSDLFGYTDPDGSKHAGVLVEYYIDVDDNPDTGDSPFWADEAGRPLVGYDARVSVMLGYEYKDKATGSTGSMSGDILIDTAKQEVVAPRATYSLWGMNKDMEFDSPDSDEMPGLYTLGADTIEIRIPYKALNLKPGAAVRLCFKDAAEGGASGKGFSEDKRLKLK